MRGATTNCPGCGWVVERRNVRGRLPTHCDGACRARAYRARRAAASVDQQRERLHAQIERDQRIADENTIPFAIRAVPGMVILPAYGPGFPALGRVRQAE